MNKSELKLKFISLVKRIVPEIFIILGGFSLDLIAKAIVQASMQEGEQVVLIPKFLNFCYVKNTKAAFGSDFGLGKWLGDTGALIFFIVLTLAAVGLFGYLLFKNPKKGMLYRISISLIIAGALGNLVDRIFLGFVRDFIQFEYFGLKIFGSYTFAIFNIADACVVMGAVMLLVWFIFFDKVFRKTKANEDESSACEETQCEGEVSDGEGETADDAKQEATDDRSDERPDDIS